MRAAAAVLALAPAFAAASCKPWCVEPCESLNGDPSEECGSCTDAKYLCRPSSSGGNKRASREGSIYTSSLEVTDFEGSKLSMAALNGKPCLLVNVASR
mmetsp:Transcript_51687/g.116064  ORF Transcript_51687/g.116064 Transcript_51687/m.116064 type:complete len:99 (+) Transcript_51687:26-322(+)